jgi:hypothetical protein
MRGPLPRRLRRAGIAGICAALVAAPAAGWAAELPTAEARLGSWTKPFEEGGAETPRCVPDGDSGFTVCKPAANAASVLPDGRILYYMGLEGHGDQERGSTVLTAGPSARDGQVRILDLRDGSPSWSTPGQPRGGRTNPQIKEGAGYTPESHLAPGRPGDGFVGSTWGELGQEPTEPSAPPDDPAPNDGDLFCSDQVLLPDGRILFAGGTDWYNEPSVMDRNAGDEHDVGVVELEGLRNATLYDPRTDTFSEAAPMKFGRWYPANVLGPEGRPTVFGGVTQLITNSQLSAVRRTETYDPAADRWSENYANEASENSLPLYARMYLAPNGKFFYTGVGQMFGPNGAAVDEATYALQQFFDPATKQWEVTGIAPVGARSGAFVAPLIMHPPYDKLTLMTVGGTLGPPPGGYVATPLVTRTSIDANGNVSNTIGNPLNHPRWFANGVLLPDGQLLAVGGGDRDAVVDPGGERAVNTPELYNPRDDSWTPVSPHERDRTYHTTALLLPDMRVLLGGHAPIAAHYGGPNTDQGGPFANNDPDPSFEIWTPPYLQRGPRPEITGVQSGIAYGEAFRLETTDVEAIDSVLLMGMPSPNHITDPDQRALALEFRPTEDGAALEVTAPPNGNVAPPNAYYLVVNKQTPKGPVPSVARVVQLGGEANLEDAPAPFVAADSPSPGTATPPDDSSLATELRQGAEQLAAAPARSAPEAFRRYGGRDLRRSWAWF